MDCGTGCTGSCARTRDLTHSLGRGIRLRSNGTGDPRGSLLLDTPMDRPIVRRGMRRELKIFLVGVALTLAYVTTATVLGWHGWLIAVVGIALGVVYGLIATPLALGPSARLRTTEREPDERHSSCRASRLRQTSGCASTSKSAAGRGSTRAKPFRHTTRKEKTAGRARDPALASPLAS